MGTNTPHTYIPGLVWQKKARRFSQFELKVGELGFPIHFVCVSAALYHRGYAAAIFPLGEYGPFLDFSLCFLSFELLCLTMSSPSDFSFKVKEQLFEQTFCHLIFPVRGKSIVDSLWKSSSPVSINIWDRVHTSCCSRRGKQSCTQIMSCQFTRSDSLTWLVESERSSGVSDLFSFVSVDSCSSTGGRITGSATWDWQEHPVCLLRLSLSLFLSISLSLSLSRNTHFLFFSFSSLSPSSRSMSYPGLAALQQRSYLESRSAGDACRLSWVRQCCTYKQKPEWGKKRKLKKKIERQEKETAHPRGSLASLALWRHDRRSPWWSWEMCDFDVTSSFDVISPDHFVRGFYNSSFRRRRPNFLVLQMEFKILVHILSTYKKLEQSINWIIQKSGAKILLLVVIAL